MTRDPPEAPTTLQRLPSSGAQAPRARAARVLRGALSAVHGCLEPRVHPREPFVEEPAAWSREAVPYDTEDGWRCFLHRCAAPPGTTAEPVVVAHGLGLNPRSVDYAGDSLVGALQAAGFEVWLLEHRGSESGLPPGQATPFDADTIAAQDVPSALRVVLERTGRRRVGWVGHGLGGVLLYLHLAHDPQAPVFAAACLGAPVRFTTATSTARLAAAVATLLPPGLRVPSRHLLRLVSPGVVPGRGWVRPAAGAVEGPRLRGILNHSVEDLSGGLVRQVARWVATGHLCDTDDRLDYLAALEGVRLPVLVLSSTGDPICPPEAARPVLERLGPEAREEVLQAPDGGHLDLVQGPLARDRVAPAVAGWLDAHRQDAG